MTTYDVTWTVRGTAGEAAAASGTIRRDAASEAALRREVEARLRADFPGHGVEIAITEAG